MSPLSSAGHVARDPKPRLTISGLGHESRDRPQPPQGTKAEP